MKMSLVIVASMLALTASTTFTSVADAKAIACKAKMLDGKTKKWTCKSGDKCCYAPLLGTTSCAKVCL